MPDTQADPPVRPSLSQLRQLAAQSERPDPGLCVSLARRCAELERIPEAFTWLARVADSDGPYVAWASAAALLHRLTEQADPEARRCLRVAVAGSSTTTQLVALLRVAALRRGIHVVVHETPFNAYAPEILDPASSLYRFDPDYVILAPHDGAIAFPWRTGEPGRLLDEETARWRQLWEALRTHSRARVIQYNVATRPDTAWGHVAGQEPGSRDAMLTALNARLLAAATADDVLVVDCDRVAATFGKARWFDDRYWHLAKQAVALDAVPLLARHTAALLAAAEGLSPKCVVVDLDNTLWGGVIAEDGLAGISLADGPRGEAHLAFQEHLKALRARGVLLAVVSKNDEADAREPFERHPDMRLSLADFAVFRANWADKATNLRLVAEELNLGLDSLVFVDDNPAEREVVRRLAPAVEVLALPGDPAGYVRALADSLLMESAAVTDDDLHRAQRYRTRAAAATLRAEAATLQDFHRSLGMEARVRPFAEVDLSRIVQLLGKTNQFNLTTRRHGPAEVRAFMRDERAVTLSLRLRDRFGDHGLVALLIARVDGELLDIDSWLMSCRVIGRTVEEEMLARVCEIALARGCSRIRATFIPTSRNGLVSGLAADLGFAPESEAPGGETTWIYDIAARGVPASDQIATMATDAFVAA